MKVWIGAAPAIAAVTGALSGCGAHTYASRSVCAYTSNGYARLERGWEDLVRIPLERVDKEVLLSIQRCWAAHPYAGPQHPISLVDARRAPDGGFYAVFEPEGINDVQLIFRVQASGAVTGAYQYGIV